MIQIADEIGTHGLLLQKMIIPGYLHYQIEYYE